MLIVGLGTTAQVGKDTAAEYLVSKYPGKVKRVAFADKVKDVARLVFGLSEEQMYGPVSVKEAVDGRYGITPREIMQGIGDKMRGIYTPIWVETLFNTTVPHWEKQGYEVFVISDVRYPNEADFIHKQGGYVVKITRDAGGVSVGQQHSSEVSMNDYTNFDFQIVNNGSLEDYYNKIDEMMEVIYNGGTTRRDLYRL